jgi:hypothetical protein
VSDVLAIAATTRVLQGVVQKAAGDAVSGATVLTRPPERAPTGVGPDGPTVNIYLLQVAPNDAWRNEDLPTRAADGALRQRPRLVLDLQYLVSFHGDDAALVPQRMLGAVLARLQAEPRLQPATIRAALAGLGDDPVGGSDLADQVESVTVALQRFSLEDLSKLWSVLLQVPYTLSVLYRVSVVVVDPAGEVLPVEPVRADGVRVVVDRVGAAS